MARASIDAVVAAVEHLDRDQWRHVLQRVSPRTLSDLRHAVADSFQIAADFVRGAASAEPKPHARRAAAGGSEGGS